MKYHAYMHKQINGVEQSTNAKVDSGTRIPIQTDSHARALSTFPMGIQEINSFTENGGDRQDVSSQAWNATVFKYWTYLTQWQKQQTK